MVVVADLVDVDIGDTVVTGMQWFDSLCGLAQQDQCQLPGWPVWPCPQPLNPPVCDRVRKQLFNKVELAWTSRYSDSGYTIRFVILKA